MAVKVRHKDAPEQTGTASRFNTHGLGAVFVATREELYEAEASELEVFIEWVGWMPMMDAFRTNELITDNFNTYFFRPRTAEDRERGYTL